MRVDAGLRWRRHCTSLYLTNTQPTTNILQRGGSVSNHFSGLRLAPPAEDARLDLTDLYVFPTPRDPTRTVLILNSNTFAQAAAFHPDAVYRINIDNDGDAETDVAISFVFSEPDDGRQRATVSLARGADARSAEPTGEPII